MSEKKKSVVIGTSLCAESDQVVRVGLAAACAMGVTARLVHAYEVSEEGRRLALLEQLDDQARRLGAAVDNSSLRPGPADRVLHEEVAARGAELLVVGARAGEAERWPHLGSTVDRLLGQVECPLLVVHPLAVFPPRSALAPVDLSDVSAGGLRCGLPLLERWGLAPEAVEVLFVLDPLESEGSLQFAPAQVERFAAEELEHFTIAHAGPRSAELRRRVRVGRARAEAVAESDQAHTDLLLVSTRGKTGWRRWMGGSFASTVAHRAHGNILVVPRALALAAFERRGASADWQFVTDEQPQ